MIITSLLDTDLYKFSMMQVVLHQFPSANVEYKFKCRNEGINLVPFIDEIQNEIKNLCNLRFNDEELNYLRQLRFIKSDFIQFLELFKLNEKYVNIKALANGEIDLKISGPWLHIILFEIPVLAIINQVYFRNTQKTPDYKIGHQILIKKIKQLKQNDLKDLKIADYGTRRRFSKVWQEEVLNTLINQLGVDNQFAGTSNVLYAKKFNIKPLGTMAHEFLQACQSLGPRLRDSQIFAFETWAKEYRGDLGIALSDIYGLNAFLRDFDLYFCKLFDGIRHDSGDPYIWGDRILEHYKKNRIDPLNKTLIFSDSLTVNNAIDLYRYFKNHCQLSFGIGTNLTNDLGYKPLQIVIKMIKCNGQPVAKVSDDPGKGMCEDINYLNYLRQVFELN